MDSARIAIMTGIGQDFQIRTYPLTPPGEGMAKIRLIASGVCGTDSHIHEGKIPVPTPAAIGHEFVGIVEEARGDIRPGARVIVDIACPCGECLLCREGDDANCVHMGLTNSGSPDDPPHFIGGFGDYCYAPIANLIEIPDELDPKAVCVFACAGPTALHAFRLGSEAGLRFDRIHAAVVQGLGPVGMFAAMYLKAMGISNVIAVTSSKHAVREERARGFGVSEVLRLSDLSAQGVIDRVRAVTSGLGVDLAYEASGNPAAIPQGMSMLRNRGMYLIPGQYSNSGDIPVSPQQITFNALRLIGSSQYSVSDVRAYLEFMRKRPDLQPVIASLATCYPFSEIDRAFADAKAGKNIKTMLC